LGQEASPRIQEVFTAALGHHQAGRLNEAERPASYAEALSHKPDHVGALFNLALVLQMQGQLEEAAASYRRALSHKPDYAEAHNNLGLARQRAIRRESIRRAATHADGNRAAVNAFEQALIDALKT
jgi:Tfp pilus assembly protein PilF